jgi:hypothetical protein
MRPHDDYCHQAFLFAIALASQFSMALFVFLNPRSSMARDISSDGAQPVASPFDLSSNQSI